MSRELSRWERLALIQGVGEMVQGIQSAQMGPGDEHEITIRDGYSSGTRTFKVEVTINPESPEPAMQIILTEVARA